MPRLLRHVLVTAKHVLIGGVLACAVQTLAFLLAEISPLEDELRIMPAGPPPPPLLRLAAFTLDLLALDALFLLLFVWAAGGKTRKGWVVLLKIVCGASVLIAGGRFLWEMSWVAPKKAVQGATAMLSTSVAMIYYLRCRDKIPKSHQRVAFFITVVCGPVATLIALEEIFM